MAYVSTQSAPRLIVMGIGGLSSGAPNMGGRNWWEYTSTADPAATVLGSLYFTDGYQRGMRRGDWVFYTDFTTTAGSSAFGIYAVTVANSSGPCTVTSVQSTST